MSLRSTLFSTLLAGAATVALAQNPSAPLTIVVPYPAGGPLDTSARIVADGAAAQLGSITVENTTLGASSDIWHSRYSIAATMPIAARPPAIIA